MGNMNTQLKNKVMRRIYIVAFMRRFLRPFAVKSFFLMVFTVLGATLVSITNVIKNGMYSSEGVLDFVTFFVRALSRTELYTQLLFVGIVTLVVWMIIDSIRSLEHKSSMSIA